MAAKHPEFRLFTESNNFLSNFVKTHPSSQELETPKRLVQEQHIVPLGLVSDDHFGSA